MKMTNGVHIVETNEFLKNIWEREGYKEIEETKEEEPKNKGGRPKAKP